MGRPKATRRSLPQNCLPPPQAVPRSNIPRCPQITSAITSSTFLTPYTGSSAHYVNIDRASGVRPDPPTLDEAFATILPFIDTAIAAVEAEESAKLEELSAAAPPEPKDPNFTLMEPPARYNRDSPAPKRSHSESSGGESSSSTATKRLRSKRTVQYKPSALSSSSLADHGA